MPISEARRLREERAALIRQAQELSSRPRLTAEQEQQASRMLDDAARLMDRINLLERPDGGDYQIRGGPIRQETRPADERRELHQRAFSEYLRFGSTNMNPELRSALSEFRDMGSGGMGAYPGSTTGFFVPVGFVNRIEEAMRYTGPMLDADKVEMLDTAVGNPLPFPTENDTSVLGELVGENTQVTMQDVTVGQILMGAYKYSSRLVRVSLELLQDSAFNLEDFLVQTFARRLGRILNAHMTTGLGSASGQPNGIITQTLLSGSLVAAVGSASNDGTSASTNTIGSDDLVSLAHSIDVLYRPGASYMAHDSTWKKFRMTKDKYGRPLWQPSLQAGQPDQFNGYGMLTNNSMDVLQVQASSPKVTVNSVCFGPLKKYLVRRVKQMSVLRLEERFADFGRLCPLTA